MPARAFDCRNVSGCRARWTTILDRQRIVLSRQLHPEPRRRKPESMRIVQIRISRYTARLYLSARLAGCAAMSAAVVSPAEATRQAATYDYQLTPASAMSKLSCAQNEAPDSETAASIDRRSSPPRNLRTTSLCAVDLLAGPNTFPTLRRASSTSSHSLRSPAPDVCGIAALATTCDAAFNSLTLQIQHALSIKRKNGYAWRDRSEPHPRYLFATTTLDSAHSAEFSTTIFRC
jgi:hypothetical protein